MFNIDYNLNSKIISDNSIVFIDSQIDYFSTLISGVQGSEVVILDATGDGIAQITEALSQRQQISSLQIISHGDIGSLQLGTTNLNINNLDRYGEELQQWSQHLTTDADILLYGCQVAAETIGKAFIQDLSEITTADIAASNDLTGSIELGGNWDLEITTGEIETELNLDEATQESYQSLLAIPEAELVVHLDFNDPDDVGRDKSPQGDYASAYPKDRHNGILTNGAVGRRENDQFQGVVDFDGVDDYLAIANSEDLNLGTHAERSISLWFKAEDTAVAGRKQVLYEEGGHLRGLNIYLDGGQLYVGGWNETESSWLGTYLTTDRVSDDTWHHVALVLDAEPEATQVQSEVFTAYLDGVEFGRGEGSQLWSHSAGIGIGGLYQTAKFHDATVYGSGVQGLAGSIDEVKIYNQALTATEIAELAAEIEVVPPVKEAIAIAELKLDETSGTEAADTSQAGLNNPGNLINGAFFAPVGGDLGGGVTFDGVDDYLAIANSADLNLGTHSERSVSLWFKAEDTAVAERKQVLYEEGGHLRGLNIYLDGGQLYVGGWNETESNWLGTYLTTDRVSDDTWHHVALVLDAEPEATQVQSEVFTAYLDGVEFGRGEGSQLWSHSAGIGIGGLYQTTKFHDATVYGSGVQGLAGSIADVQIYNQALNQTAITNLSALKPPSSTLDLTPKTIAADNNLFHYSGRVDWQEPLAPAFSYPGTAVEFKFTGTSLKVALAEDNWGGRNYVDVYLDGDTNPTTLQLEEGREPVTYEIAKGLENKIHSALLIKRTDYLHGEFEFHGIEIDGELRPAGAESAKKIEVYGDSISAGAIVEYEQAGAKDPPGKNDHLTNAYYSFGSLLARDYDAEISLVAQGGVPLVDGYGYWNEKTGAEAFYDKSKPLDNAPLWNFNNYQPDLVVIAFGQNDSSTINLGQDLTSEQWKDRYKQFIANLRDKYPNSYFVGMFPNMYHDRQWDNFLTEAVSEYRRQTKDNRVFSLITEQVTPGHPRISEQQAMADALKDLIEGTLTDNGFHWDVAD